MKNKFISFLTVICMIISILPQTALAAITGDGSSSNPYKISTADELFAFAQLVNNGQKDANAVLTADIDLENKEWATIAQTGLYNQSYGTDDGYSGTFDGQGYTIKNLRFKTKYGAAISCGLFGTVSGTVKNLCVDGVGFINDGGDFHGGAIAGQLIKTGRISNCCVKNATIKLNVIKIYFVAGGIAGCVYEGTIENCLVYASEFNGTRYGHIVGDSRGDAGETDRPGTVNNCHTDGALAFSAQSGTITNCTSYITAKQFESGEIAYLLQNGQTEQIWGQKVGTDTHPVLNGQKVYIRYTDCIHKEYTNDESQKQDTPREHSYTNGRCIVCGKDSQGRYPISTADELFAFAQLVNDGEKSTDAVLTADIDLNNTTWTTIAETDLYHNGYGTDDGYSGTFDGQGHKITNLALQSSATKDASCGLFGTVSGTVKNLCIDGVTLNDGGKDMRTGAVAGQLIKSGNIINCCVTNAAITPGEHVNGGIAGAVYEGTVENCLVIGSTVNGTGSRHGYIVGDTRGDNGTTDRFGTVKN